MIETSPQNRHLGYARVSTYGQTLDAQLQQFRAEGCAKVYREKASGAQTNRVRLRRALDQLAKGDVLTVTRAQAFVPCMTHGPTRRPPTGVSCSPC
jgi:Resolvase, N terminal domain